MTILFAFIILVFLFVCSASIVILFIGPVMLLQPHRRTVDYYRRFTSILHPRDLGLPFEELALKTAEGIHLSCWLIKAPHNPRGTVIYLHGVSECKIVGLPLARELYDSGYNVFLYDSRRHGDSDGKYCTYGFYEKHDTTTIINYLVARPDLTLRNIGLLGTSMGAAVALQVAAIDQRVRAVVAESGFATLRSIFDDYQRRMIKLPWHYLRNIVIKRSEYMAHFKANSVSPLDAVRNINVPLFILHGTVDNLIAHKYSQMIFDNAHPPKELWLIQGAKHNDMTAVGGKEYTRRILGFFDESLHTV
jgi:alpha-beta hydrolase superfamily lysophospholipase